MKKQTKTLLFWAPRVLGILFVLFTNFFALDVFDEASSFWGTVTDLATHLIPTFLLALLLAIAWRWEPVGAVLFFGLAVFCVVGAWGRFPGSTYAVMTGPLLLISFLLMLNWVYNPKEDGETRPVIFLYITIAVFVIYGIIIIILMGSDVTPKKTAILNPANNQLVNSQEQAIGEYAKADSLNDLWLVVQQGDTGAYHPQAGPAMKQPHAMKWYTTALYGSEGEPSKGQRFYLYLYSGTKDAGAVFNNYSDKQQTEQLWPGLKTLPGGLTPLDTVVVIRK